MTAILALDLGTTTGWAMRTTNGQVVSGTTSFRPGRFEGGGMRLLRFRGWLAELASTSFAPSVVSFEEVRRHAAEDAARVNCGLKATLTAWCEQHGLPYAGYAGVPARHRQGQRLHHCGGERGQAPRFRLRRRQRG